MHVLVSTCVHVSGFVWRAKYLDKLLFLLTSTVLLLCIYLVARDSDKWISNYICSPLVVFWFGFRLAWRSAREEI